MSSPPLDHQKVAGSLYPDLYYSRPSLKTKHQSKIWSGKMGLLKMSLSEVCDALWLKLD